MPYETKAQVQSERDDLRNALESILDRVTAALGVEEDEAKDNGEAKGEADDEDAPGSADSPTTNPRGLI